MKSKDLKNSNELAKSENSELEKSEQLVGSESQELVDSASEINEENIESVEKQLEKSVSEKEKPVKTKVEKLPKKPLKTKDTDLVTETADENTAKTEIENTAQEVEKPVSVEIEEPQAEKANDEIKDSSVQEEEVLEAEVAEKEKQEKPADEKATGVDETSKPEKKDLEAVADDKIHDKPSAEVVEETKADVVSTTKSEVKKPKEVVVHLEDDKEKTDYSKYNQVELINAMRDLLDNYDGNDVKPEIDVIKSVFYKKRKEKIEEERIEFVENGGMVEEFVPEEDPYENDIRDLLKRYGQVRKDLNKQLDSEKEDNLKRKFEIIESIKALINNEESINKTFNEFRDLQREWREIGLVPQSKMKNLWDTYHFHVENFYDYIKINRELRDLDLKKNLELKIELCERAEELMVEPSILKAFNTLQKYHEQWREIGPVPRENKDDIWERFKRITSIINKKHQEFFESKKDEQKNNLDAKTALCEKVEEICNSEIEGYRDWDSKSKELVELQKIWRTIGFAPKKENNRIYERFRNACDTFFNKKREFYSKNKEIQQNNLQQKIDLCMQAEELKENTDWKKATQDFINIQKKWKEIGPIPRKHSDLIWKRFRAACDYFFDKKSEHFSDVDSEQIDNLKKKEDLIAELENFKKTGDVNENLRILKDIQRRWTEIGHVPFKKKDALQNKFREEIGKLFDQLNINEDKRNMLKFKTKMTTFSESSRGQSKMRMEREKYMNKLKQLENDLVLLENNIGFFTMSKNAKALIEDVNKKIEDTRQRIESLKEKIRVIDEMED